MGKYKQSDDSIITLQIDGYQQFSIDRFNIPYDYSNKYKIVNKMLKRLYPTCQTLVDLGCNNGLISALSSNIGYKVVALDQDSRYIDTVDKISRHCDYNIDCRVWQFGDDLPNCDIVVMLAMVHWVYHSVGSTRKLLKYLITSGAKYLVIEWLDESLIGKFLVGTRGYSEKKFINRCRKIGKILNVKRVSHGKRIYLISVEST